MAVWISVLELQNSTKLNNLNMEIPNKDDSKNSRVSDTIPMSLAKHLYVISMSLSFLRKLTSGCRNMGS